MIGRRFEVIRGVCGVLADDLRDYAGQERFARGVLTALIVAIEQDQLDSLFATVQPWIAAEVARQDALKVESGGEPEPDSPFTVVQP